MGGILDWHRFALNIKWQFRCLSDSPLGPTNHTRAYCFQTTFNF